MVFDVRDLDPDLPSHHDVNDLRVVRFPKTPLSFLSDAWKARIDGFGRIAACVFHGGGAEAPRP